MHVSGKWGSRGHGLHVISAISAIWRYLLWLRNEAEETQPAFVAAMSAAVRKFNKSIKPRDLGLDDAAFPFNIWRMQELKRAQLDARDVVSVGEVLEHCCPVNHSTRSPQAPLEHSVVVEVLHDSLEVMPSGVEGSRRRSTSFKNMSFYIVVLS